MAYAGECPTVGALANNVRGKISQYSCSLNQAHLMSNSFRPGTRARGELRSERSGGMGRDVMVTGSR
jgi:hypothetical protein